MNKKAQSESGPLQKIFIAVIITAMLGVAASTLIADLNNNYGASLDDDNFTQFMDEYESLANVSEELGDAVSDIDSAGDIIVVAVTGGYQSLIKFLTAVPQIMDDMVRGALNALGLGQYAGFLYLILFTIIIFAIIALIMKVRG